MALSKSESDYYGPEDVAPSFPIHIERLHRRTPLQVVREVIVEFNRRIDDPVQKEVRPRTFEPRPEPPEETLIGNIQSARLRRQGLTVSPVVDTSRSVL
jgi:hypothetical protein